MLNNLKRALLSIKEHKKDSILIFLIVLTLTTFMMIYLTFYKTSDSFSSTIKDNTKVTITMSNNVESNVDTATVNELLANNEELFNSYKEQLLYFVDFVDSLNNESHALLHGEFKNDALRKSALDTLSVYSFNEDLLNNEDFIITQGRLLNELDADKIIINEELYKQLDDETHYNLTVGDYISLTNAKGDIYKYEIVGTFKNNSSKTIINENKLYDKNTSAILLSKDLLNIISANDSYSLTDGVITMIGENHLQEMLNHINSSYKRKTIIKDSIEINMGYLISYDNSLIAKLNKPIKNLSILFQTASIIIIIIMFLLLLNFLSLVIFKRKQDIAIFIALGQSKLKTVFNFFLEIFLIFTLAYLLSIPIGSKIASSITEKMIVSNLNKQELISEITGEEIDEFEISKQSYQDYKLSIDLDTCLIVYASSLSIIFISSIYALIKISLISPKELLNK